jgi:hypothetical protein
MPRDGRGAIVSVRLSEEQQDRLRRIAEARGESMSEVIRSYVAAENTPSAAGMTISTAPNSVSPQFDTGLITWTTTVSSGESVGTTLTVRAS